ncbi:ribosomal protein L7/L12 [Streptomyces sp. NPDC059863]|uniref:ribosomal protein L7/L12 n=1 Tax=unclassified Streptomyces TaxID=2593676 RepID=UPI0036604F5F
MTSDPADHARHSVVLVAIPAARQGEVLTTVQDHGATWSGELPDLVLRQADEERAQHLAMALTDIGAVTETWPEPTPGHVAVEPQQGSDLVVVASTPSDTWVVLAHAGDRKIQAIKAIRTITEWGLKEAKDLTDEAPSMLGPFVREQAEAAADLLTAAGATCEIIEPSPSSMPLNVILTAIPPGRRRSWPSWLKARLGGKRRIAAHDKPFVIAPRVSHHIADKIVRTIDELGGETMTVPSESHAGEQPSGVI